LKEKRGTAWTALTVERADDDDRYEDIVRIPRRYRLDRAGGVIRGNSWKAANPGIKVAARICILLGAAGLLLGILSLLK
jgi:hypothetical protein